MFSIKQELPQTIGAWIKIVLSILVLIVLVFICWFFHSYKAYLTAEDGMMTGVVVVFLTAIMGFYLVFGIKELPT